MDLNIRHLGAGFRSKLPYIFLEWFSLFFFQVVTKMEHYAAHRAGGV